MVCRSNCSALISLLESTDGTSSARDSSSSSISLPVRRLQHLTTAARQASAQMETNSVGSEVTMCMSMDVSRTNKSSMDTKSPSTPGLRDNEERKKAMSSSSSNLEYGNATHSRSSQQASSMCDNISEQSYTSNQVLKWSSNFDYHLVKWIFFFSTYSRRQRRDTSLQHRKRKKKKIEN